MVLLCRLGSTEQTVQMGNDIGILLHLGNELLGSNHQVHEKLLFQREYFVLCTQYLFFVFLQLLGDVALSLCQRLLAHPLLRHLVLIGVAHLQVVAEDIVIAYLQRIDARLLGFALLNLQQIVLARIGNTAQLVQLRTHSVADDATLLNLLGRIVLYLVCYAVAKLLAEVQALPYPLQRLVGGLLTGRLDGFNGLKGCLELHHLARRHTSYSHFRHYALQVTYVLQLVVNGHSELWLAEEVVDNVQTLVDGLLVLQGEHQPATQQSSAHGRHRPVNDIQQRLAVFLHGADELQRTDSELIQTHVALLLNA